MAFMACPGIIKSVTRWTAVGGVASMDSNLSWAHFMSSRETICSPAISSALGLT